MNTVVILTQYKGAILGPIAKILGIIINFIFNILDSLGIPNVGLSIIIFTFIIYIALLPLTFKQQKFSKMSAIMNPEIKAVQEKYKGKNDNESMTKQNEELQEIYAKYGVSPTGSCIQLIIQMPILFALYRVIYNVPAYVDKVYASLKPLADNIMSSNGGVDFIKSLETSTRYFSKYDFTSVDTIIDVLNRASGSEWLLIKENIPSIVSIFDKQQAEFLNYYSFGLINIADTPQVILSNGLSEKSIALILGAILVPALAALTQWLNVLFMPQAGGNDDNSAVASSMKTMNVMMPIMSAVFCFTLPAGMGIYWISSAVIRSIEQVCINKYFDKIGIDEIIEKNKEKAAKKKASVKKTKSESYSSSSSKNRSFDSIKNIPSVEKDSSYSPKKDSMAWKANLVKKYNEEKKDE